MSILSKLLPYVIKYQKWIWLSSLSHLLLSIFTVFSIPMVIPFFRLLFTNESRDTSQLSSLEKWLYDFFSGIIERYGNEKSMTLVCLALVLVFMARNVFRYAALSSLVPFRNGIVRDLRSQLHHKYLDLPLKYYSDKRKGDLIARATSDVAEIDWSILNVIEAIFKAPIIISGCLAFMAFVNIKLTMFVLVLIAFTALIIGGISRKLKSDSGAIQEKVGLLTSLIEETINGLRVLKMGNAQNYQKQKFDAVNQSFYQAVNRLMFRKELSVPMSEFLGVSTVVALLWFGARLVFKGEILPETFFAFILAFYQVIEPSKQLSNAYFNLQKGSAALDRINGILASPNDTALSNLETSKLDFTSTIEIKDLSFQYRDSQQKALDKISFSIQKGQRIAIVGKSGSGKSTLIDLLLRIQESQEGSILLDGVSINNLNVNAYRDLFGVVPQETILFNDTIGRNIVLSDHDQKEMLNSALVLSYSSEFVDLLPNQSAQTIGDKGNTLSGGQRQRISIARAIYRNPPILVMDEATSSLDTTSELKVQQSLEKAMEGRTSIIIAHRLSTVQKADHIIVLEKGKIVEQGSHEELLAKKGFYLSLVKDQLL